MGIRKFLRPWLISEVPRGHHYDNVKVARQSIQNRSPWANFPSTVGQIVIAQRQVKNAASINRSKMLNCLTHLRCNKNSLIKLAVFIKHASAIEPKLRNKRAIFNTG